jgi:hypothetical protein
MILYPGQKARRQIRQDLIRSYAYKIFRMILCERIRSYSNILYDRARILHGSYYSIVCPGMAFYQPCLFGTKPLGFNTKL